MICKTIQTTTKPPFGRSYAIKVKSEKMAKLLLHLVKLSNNNNSAEIRGLKQQVTELINTIVEKDKKIDVLQKLLRQNSQPESNLDSPIMGVL